MGKYAAIITCRTVDGEERTTATVYGSWAVHKSLDNGARDWAITQVTTGLAIPREHSALLNKKDAIEVAKRIDAMVGEHKVTHAVGRRIVEIVLAVMAGKP